MATLRPRRLSGLPAWVAYLVAGAAAIGSYYLLPTWQNEVVYTAIGVSAVAAIAEGVRRHRPAHGLPWWLFAGGLLLFVAADVIWTYDELVRDIESPFPSTADWLYLGAYPLLIAGLVLLVRHARAGGGRTIMLDAAIVTVNFGVPAWLYLIGPYARDDGLASLERALLVAYPVLDLVLVFALVRLLLAGKVRTGALGLVIASVAVMLFGDVTYIGVVSEHGSGDWLNAVWLSVYVLWGAAALHPSMATTSTAPARTDAVARPQALLLGLAAALVVPATLMREAVGSALSPDEVAVAAAAFLLVVFRLATVMRELTRARRVLAGQNERLAESETLFRLLAEDAHDVVLRYRMRPAPAFEYASPSVVRLTGYTPEELYADPALHERVIHPDDREAVLAARLAGTDVGLHQRWVRKDGRVIWVETSGTTTRDANGAPVAFAGIVRDITEPKLADIALRESEARFRQLVENLPLITYRAAIDEKATPLWISSQVEAMLGYTPGEWLGEPDLLERLTHPDDLDAVLAGIAEQNAHGGRLETEYRVIARDGREVWLHDTTVVVHDDDGNALHTLGFAVDVTERKRAEEALRESEERFRSTFENAPDGIALVALDGRFLRVNGPFCVLVGRSEEELLATTWEALSGMSEERAALLAGLVSGEAPVQRVELALVHRLGHDVWTLASGSLVRDRAGAPAYVVAQVKDITARREAEAEVEQARRVLAEQNERLIAVDRAKDEFISLVSHDLRTPLTSIMGYLDILLDGETGELTEEQLRFLGIVRRNSERLLRLVNDLLFVARLASSGTAVAPEAVDLASLAKSAVEALRPAAAAKGIELTLALDGASRLTGDRELLERMLENLLSNAVKFTPAAGRVDVHVAELAGAVLVELTDTGMGIPAGEREHLFERFYRTSTATRQAVPGTGLGLYMVKEIVDAHGGAVAVESVEGVGTTFRVTLPVIPGAALAA